jgi:DNA repair exonuclease SbcCD nuclease subunit
MFRFLHSSDLHIGKRFANLPEDLRGRLREARHTAIDRLAQQALEHGAGTILLAGDTFDTETPTPAMLRQALAAMRDHEALGWVILPGNHDSLLAEELWAMARAALPPNVKLAIEAVPMVLEEGVTLLPAPCTTRRPGRDLTDWMDAASTPDAELRIGIAHGAIQSFSEEGGTLDIIAPDRARRAGLDYLALGDWHGQIEVNERTWYAGTPEPDRFKHSAPGQALLVSLAGRGAPPDVQPVATALFEWRTLDLGLLSGDEVAQAVTRILPVGAVRRQTLLRMVATGRVKITQRAALTAAFAAATPEFAYAMLEDEGLATDCEISDLDAIDQGGALRQAAEALLAEANDEGRAAGERGIAREALVRLFSYCGAMQQ